MIGNIIGNFKIIDFIEEGGMGKVYLARQLTIDREVAIKILDPSLSKNPQFKERFINEANALAKLNHTNIVSIYDFVEYEGNYCIIMEYVKGTTLDKIIENNNIDISFSVNIINQLLEGLSYAHKQSIVHRDIKPSNIIIDPDNRVKILDFGIAKMVLSNSNLTKTGTRMGSICYMSPEQILGKELDLKTDIYSAGITFYELLSGQLPYDINTESDYIVQNKIVNDSLPDIRTLNPAIPQNIADAINFSTRKNPDDRFIDCDEFKKFVSGVEITSKPENKITQTQRKQTQYINTTANTDKTVYIQPNNIDKESKYISVGKGLIFGAVFLILLIFSGVIYYFNSVGNNKNGTTDEHSYNSLNEETKNKSEDVYLAEAKSQLDKKKYNDALSTYQTFVKQYPNSEKAVFAYQQIAGIQIDALKKPKDGIATYTTLAEKFPDTKDAKQSLFMIAFIYDENLKDKAKAITAYKYFLAKYPKDSDTDGNDKMSESAATMLEVLESGKSIEEMIQQNIEKSGKTK
jgi:serine/threonine protein kinase